MLIRMTSHVMCTKQSKKKLFGILIREKQMKQRNTTLLSIDVEAFIWLNCRLQISRLTSFYDSENRLFMVYRIPLVRSKERLIELSNNCVCPWSIWLLAIWNEIGLIRIFSKKTSSNVSWWKIVYDSNWKFRKIHLK